MGTVRPPCHGSPPTPCQYGDSRLSFRGPQRSLEGDYTLFLGGVETYGKFVPVPFPALLEERVGLPCVNMGCINAGVDTLLKDYWVMDAANRARVVVLQVSGAHMLSNRFYTVHPRRNDRFLRASAGLQALYPDVDFTAYTFTRHLLNDLRDRDPRRFLRVIAELRAGWRARTRTLISEIGRPVLLFWFADHLPGPAGQDPTATDPLFVGEEDIAAVRGACCEVVTACVSDEARVADLVALDVTPEDQAAASRLPGMAAHREAAEALAAPLERILRAAAPVPDFGDADRGPQRPVTALRHSLSVIPAGVLDEVGGPFWH